MTASALRARPGRRGSGKGPSRRALATRPLMLPAALAALAAAGVGLAVLTVLVVAGWIAAPHAGAGLPGALRAAAALWLVAHHVGITVRGAGRIGMLPLGLVPLPGLLLWRAGHWLVRSRSFTGFGPALAAALAIAGPYALICGLLAAAARTELAAPSLPQAMLAGFAVAAVAAGLGAARALAPWARLGSYLPARLRAVLAGAAASLAVLIAAGAVLAAVALAAHDRQYTALNAALAPGPVGAALLLAAEVGYLPNAVIWAVSFTLGSGFAVGSGTIVAPTGTVLGALPQFPMLAALPSGPHGALPGWQAAVVLAVPYLAGVAGGLICARAALTPVLEAAPMWGFCCGALAGAVLGVLAVCAGGSLGDGRLAAIGPSPWQVTTLATLEVGVAAAVTAGLANWRLVRRQLDPATRSAGHESGSSTAELAGPREAARKILYLNRWAAEQEPAPPRSGRGPAALP